MSRILITGAAGKMGLETIKAVLDTEDLELVGCLGNKSGLGQDIGQLIGRESIGIKITDELDSVIKEKKPDLIVDFTHAEPAAKIITTALNNGISCITGSTGFSEQQLIEFRRLAEEKDLTLMVIPNFSIGAVLMTLLAQQAGKYFHNVEIIEMHHEKKKDSPSGTAIKTAAMIAESSDFNTNLPESIEKINGCRGGQVKNINIHSIRMPGFVASQEVIFGGLGQTLTIRHNTINREAFMPGVILAIRKAEELKGYIYGLESLL